ncbi:MAG TPA: methyltransferase [Flavobacteriales bacterium]|nr:methyltransferase [Flavobacteriales bacterium]
MRGKKNNNPFVLKQFTVLHHLCAHKVGFDGVLLGAWTNFTESNSILDIGTGSGLLALMAAQKNAVAKIYAVEMDENSVLQARENFANSLWDQRLEVKQGNFFEMPFDAKFDHIVTNPPYFIDGLKTPFENRTTARHFTREQFGEFMMKTAGLLNAGGRLSMIVPGANEDDILSLVNHAGYYLTRKCRVFTKNADTAERILLECSLERHTVEENNLFVYDATGKHSAEYCKLTSDFYPHY